VRRRRHDPAARLLVPAGGAGGGAQGDLGAHPHGLLHPLIRMVCAAHPLSAPAFAFRAPAQCPATLAHQSQQYRPTIACARTSQVMHDLRSPLLSVLNTTATLSELESSTPLGAEDVARSLDVLSRAAGRGGGAAVRADPDGQPDAAHDWNARGAPRATPARSSA
jgi:hypothetical protein